MSSNDFSKLVKDMNKTVQQQSLERYSLNASSEKRPPYTKSVSVVDYNAERRTVKLEFVVATPYKKVVSYKQINGKRYPTEYAWSERTKKTSLSLKLTNDVVETLDKHENNLVRDNAKVILEKLLSYDKSLKPSWYAENVEQAKCNEKLKEERALLNQKTAYYNSKIQRLKQEYSKQLSKIDKVEQKIWLARQKGKRKTALEKLEKKKSLLQEEIPDYYREKDMLEKELSDVTIAHNKKVMEIKTEEQAKMKKIKPLAVKIEQVEQFIPLSQVAAYSNDNPRKGCYIIRNVENNKYYVGQSKDILKRLHQHFAGTKPKNIIFAEDYFKSKNPDNLFEVRFVFCETKDELDETERFYIEKYDAFRNGYNGTAGNI